MKRLALRLATLVSLVLAIPSLSSAAHPLITDDTGTQGKGRFQFELNGEYGHDRDNGITTNTTALAVALTYGAADALDLILGIPYQRIRVKEPEATSSSDGLSDLSIELKWRFCEKDGLSLAIRPGVTLPTGDEGKGLGAGRTTVHVFLIASRELKPWAVHANLGYIRNENRLGERKNLWHASVAATVDVADGLRLVCNIGVERNTDRFVNTHPVFAIGGLIYAVNDNFDIDLGVKAGLNEPETDYALLSGITWRF